MDRLDGVELHFPNGLPGFESATRFLVKEDSSFAPVLFLKAVDMPELCFLAVPIGFVVEAYELGVSAEDLRTLELDEGRQPVLGEEVRCLVILTAPGNGPVTANLLAPVVINPRNLRGVQAVRSDTLYSHQHQILAFESEAKC